jgi:hypothetical protein
MEQFKEIDVTIEGIGEGLLMHSPTGMLDEPTTKKNPAKQYDAEKDAEAVTYRNKQGNLYIPSRAVKGCILNASGWYKFGKRSAKPILAGGIRIEPSDVELIDKKGKVITKYEIDRRTVVIQRQRIVRARPLIREWRAKFKIIYDPTLIQETEIIHEILKESGKRIGLLDNRPQKYGDNGLFVVEKFLPKK